MKTLIKIIAVLALVFLGATQSVAQADDAPETTTLTREQVVIPGTVLEPKPEPVEPESVEADAPAPVDDEPSEAPEEADAPEDEGDICDPEYLAQHPEDNEPLKGQTQEEADYDLLTYICPHINDPYDPSLQATDEEMAEACRMALDNDPNVTWYSETGQSEYEVRVQQIKDTCPEGTPIPPDDGTTGTGYCITHEDGTYTVVGPIDPAICAEAAAENIPDADPTPAP